MGSNFWTHNGRAWLGPSDGPIFSRREFLDCAVASFAVRLATWLEISEIVFVNSTTEVLSACVAVARFSSATVWSCYNSVKSAALACGVCIFAAYPSVFVENGPENQGLRKPEANSRLTSIELSRKRKDHPGPQRLRGMQQICKPHKPMRRF